jgi:hypothetical protein
LLINGFDRSGSIRNTQRVMRVRLSPLKLLSAATIVTLTIVLAFTLFRLQRVEDELEARRIESGQLVITDPLMVHVIGVSTDRPMTWRWRVYLPDPIVGHYNLNCYSGRHVPLGRSEFEQWLIDNPYGTDSTPFDTFAELPKGEIMIEAQLVKRVDDWYMRISPIGEKHLAIEDNWLATYYPPQIVNGVPVGRQAKFDRGSPIPLLLIQSDPFTMDGYYVANKLHRIMAAHSVVLWISKSQDMKRTPLDL